VRPAARLCSRTPEARPLRQRQSAPRRGSLNPSWLRHKSPCRYSAWPPAQAATAGYTSCATMSHGLSALVVVTSGRGRNPGQFMIRGRTVRNVLLAVAALALLALVVAVGLAWYTARTAVDRSAARQGAALAKYHQAFLDDQRFAATLPIFARRSGDRDASLVIGPRVGWIVADPKAIERYRQSLPEDARGLELDAGVAEKVGKDWLDSEPALWTGLDFSWMSRLAAYDYWDLDRNSPDPFPPGWLRGPSPDITKLSAWTKLRLAKGIREGDPAVAIREAEELARLCVNADEIGVVQDGLHLLHLIEQARERAPSSSGVVGALGQPVGKEGIRRLGRAAWGATAYAELRASPTHDADWGRITVGKCAALASGLVGAVVARPLLDGSHRTEYERLGRILASSPECRLHRLRLAWSRPGPADLTASLDGSSWLERFAIRWIPGARALLGEVLMAISEQDWFRQYDEPAATPRPGAVPMPGGSPRMPVRPPG